MNIQEVGFDVQLSGSNAGAALGRGLYVTNTLEKHTGPPPYPYIIIELEGATRTAQARTVTRDKEENPAYGEKEFV